MIAYKRSLLVLPVVMLALTSLACAVPGAPAPTATAAPTVAAPPTDVPATVEPTAAVEPTVEVTAAVSSDAKAELVAAIQAALTAGPYNVVSSLVSATTNVQEHGDVILPDKFHLFASLNGIPEREYLIVGGVSYTKVGDQWVQSPTDLSGFLQNFVNTFDPDKISNVILVGIEDLSGTSAKHFTFTYTNEISGVTIENTVNMWVGVDSGLPLKQVIDGTANGHPYQAIQTIKYDPTITIVAP
jgi:hypothetical protein